MSTGAIIGIVAAVVVLALLAVLVRGYLRRKHLRERFGPEYDRTVAERPRREAERELAEREKRYSELDIRRLDADTRARYVATWTSTQEQFVDRPAEAVAEADRLVTALMGERGYPTDGSFDQRLADLSVQHARTLEHYRAAHDIHRRQAANGRADSQVSTEDLREAMVRYRALFEDLLGPADAEAGDRHVVPGSDRNATPGANGTTRPAGRN